MTRLRAAPTTGSSPKSTPASNPALQAEPQPPQLQARLFGTFALTDQNGQNVAPASAKARAIVATVLSAPNATRARSYLADTLWSTRARAQALASLRQALTELRAALGDAADVLIIDRQTVSFRPGSVTSDLDQAEARIAQGHPFLEDINISDPAFTQWLANARSQFDMRARSQHRRPFLHVTSRGQASEIHHRALSSGVADSISDWCAMRIASTSVLPETTARQSDIELADYLLSAQLEQGEAGVAAHLSLGSGGAGDTMWSMTGVLPSDPARLIEEGQTYRLINQAADRTLLDLSSQHADTDIAQHLTTGALGAAWRIFRNDTGDLDAARTQLQRNFELHRQGVYLAWQAYIKTIELAETHGPDRDAMLDEAEALVAHALELEPYGSMTLALCSYVTSFVLNRRAEGFALATRAIESNRANPLAWIFRGASRFFEGDGTAASRDTEFARLISGNGPYRYVVETFCCAAATADGRLSDAIHHAESAARLAPRYRAPLRYLVAIHSAQGNIDELRLVLRRLRRLEPAFTIDSMRDKAYPVPGLRASGLIDPS